MKRNKLIVLAFCLLFTLHSFSQKFKDFKWDKYKIGFSIPTDFKITENTETEFTAENNNLFLTLSPIKDRTIDHDHLQELLLEMAKELKYDEIDDADELELDGLEGYFIEGKKDGVNAVLVALLNPKSSTNLFMVIIYKDKTPDDAIEIISSLYAY